MSIDLSQILFTRPTAYWLSLIKEEPVKEEDVTTAQTVGLFVGTAVVGAALGAAIYGVAATVAAVESIEAAIALATGASVTGHVALLEGFYEGKHLKWAAKECIDGVDYLDEKSRQLGAWYDALRLGEQKVSEGTKYWTQFLQTGRSDINWGDYLLKLDYYFSQVLPGDPPTGDLAFLEKRWSTIMTEAETTVLNEADPQQRIPALMDFLLTATPLKYYRKKFDSLAVMLGGTGGNCEAEFKLLLAIFSELEKAGIDLGLEGFAPGVQYYTDHIRLIFYHPQKNLVFDPLTQSIEIGLTSDLYDPHVYLYYYLLKRNPLAFEPDTIFFSDQALLYKKNVPSHFKRKIPTGFGCDYVPIDTDSPFSDTEPPDEAVFSPREKFNRMIEKLGPDQTGLLYFDPATNQLTLFNSASTTEQPNQLSGQALANLTIQSFLGEPERLKNRSLAEHLSVVSTMRNGLEDQLAAQNMAIEGLHNHQTDKLLSASRLYHQIANLDFYLFIIFHSAYIDFIRRQYQFELSQEEVKSLEDARSSMAQLESKLYDSGKQLAELLSRPNTQQQLASFLFEAANPENKFLWDLIKEATVTYKGFPAGRYNPIDPAQLTLFEKSAIGSRTGSVPLRSGALASQYFASFTLDSIQEHVNDLWQIDTQSVFYSRVTRSQLALALDVLLFDVQIDPAFKRELSSEEIGPPPADSNLMIVQPEFLPLIFLDGGRTGIEAVKRSGLLPAALERTAPLLSSWFASNHPMLTTKYGLYLTNSLSGFLAMVLQQGEKSYLDREFILWPLPEALSLKDVNSLADLASRLAKAYPQLSLKINLWEAQLYLKANFATLKAEHHLPLSYSPDDTDVKLKVNKVLPLSDDDLAKLNELMNLKINFSCDF